MEISTADVYRALWPGIACVLGLLVGSFANVCIHRIPLGQSVARPRSRCPRCGHELAWWENVPVLSWLALGRRCRSCREPISIRYPLVEGGIGALWWLAARVFGMTGHAAVVMAFSTLLVVLALIDFDHHILPDVLTLPGILAGWWATLVPGSPSIHASLFASAGLYLVFFALAEGFRRVRGIEGLGMGDWKMAAMLGAFLGWQKGLLVVFLAALLGLVVGGGFMLLRGKERGYELPLGTFLSLGGLLTLFAGDQILSWYASFSAWYVRLLFGA